MRENCSRIAHELRADLRAELRGGWRTLPPDATHHLTNQSAASSSKPGPPPSETSRQLSPVAWFGWTNPWRRPPGARRPAPATRSSSAHVSAKRWRREWRRELRSEVEVAMVVLVEVVVAMVVAVAARHLERLVPEVHPLEPREAVLLVGPRADDA